VLPGARTLGRTLELDGVHAGAQLLKDLGGGPELGADDVVVEYEVSSWSRRDEVVRRGPHEGYPRRWPRDRSSRGLSARPLDRISRQSACTPVTRS
jgi:hypothetical protein